jgi:hypothetical protein
VAAAVNANSATGAPQCGQKRLADAISVEQL